MSWFSDAAKSAANKAEAALQKLDKDGGEVVVAAKRELLASSDGTSAAPPAPPPQQLSRRPTEPRAPAPRLDRVVLKPLDGAASPGPATRTPPEATKRGSDGDTAVVSSVPKTKTKTKPARVAETKTTTTRDVISETHAARASSDRRARRLALLDHARALVAARNEEARAAARDAAEARDARAVEAATTSLRGDAAAGAADAAAARLRALRGARAAAQDAADTRLAERAGVGGERARRLHAEQRALVSATRRRDDAADAVAAAEQRVAAARGAEDGETSERAARESAEAEASASCHIASVAALEAKLRETRAAAEACRRRLAARASNRETFPETQKLAAAEDAMSSSHGALENRLRRVADALFAEQSRCEALKSDKAALVFRLESARAESARLDAFASEARPESLGADADVAAWTDSDLDDDEEAGLGVSKRNGRASRRSGGAPSTMSPSAFAYEAVTFVFGAGARNRRVARGVSEAVSALDRATLFALTAWGKTRAARVAFAAYALVMHVYVFALLRFGGGGPRATNTETATSVG